jgi:hypothetical protein
MECTLYITVINRMAIRCHDDMYVSNCTLYSNIAATCLGCKQPSSVSALRHKQISKPLHCHFCNDGSPTLSHTSFIFPKTSRPVLGPTQPPTQWVKQPQCDTSPHIHLVRRFQLHCALYAGMSCKGTFYLSLLSKLVSSHMSCIRTSLLPTIPQH